jgi:hypothetical protein
MNKDVGPLNRAVGRMTTRPGSGLFAAFLSFAALKLERTWLVLADQVMNEAATSVYGTFETCRLTVRMSVVRGIAEVVFRGRQDRY